MAVNWLNFGWRNR